MGDDEKLGSIAAARANIQGSPGNARWRLDARLFFAI
jgi:hypothetical protein